MNFQPLTSERLSATQSVAAELFPWEREHETALAAAVDPQQHLTFFLDRRLASVRCWTALDPAGAVCGLGTLYGYTAQPEELWLAWFGLTASARGNGAGALMLDWLIARAKHDGHRTLRLWTTDEAEYSRATQLYLRRGFAVEDHPALPGEDWRTLVFSLGLDGSRPQPWSAIADRGELCGREVPALAVAAA